MTAFSIFDRLTGRVMCIFQGRRKGAEMQCDDSYDFVKGHYPAANYWIVSGEAVPRPKIVVPATHSLSTDTDWTLPDVPEGTQVLIDGAEAGTVDGDGLTLTFPEARKWHVELRPPFPWRPAECEVTVA